MKNLFLLVVIALSWNARAEDDCTADVSQYTEAGLKARPSSFDKKSKLIKTHLGAKLVSYSFEERVLLAQDIEVSLTIGGCAHYGFRFVFKGAKIEKLKDSEKLARTRKLLAALPLTSDQERAQLIGALDAAKKSKKLKWENGVLALPCGDAFCDLVDQGNQQIEIGYSFAL